MNIVLFMDTFNNDFINFLETKDNIVTNGVFTKIMYSNTLFTMNGLYFYLPLNIQDIHYNSYNKTYIKFDANIGINKTVIQHLTNIEKSILNLYDNYKDKKYVLHNQLSSGFAKIHSSKSINEKTQFIVKISGIWENESSIGITYKIIPIQNMLSTL